MDRQNFEDLDQMADTLKDEFEEFNGEGMLSQEVDATLVNEYGELEDDAFSDTIEEALESDELKDSNLEDTAQTTQHQPIAVDIEPTTQTSNPKPNSWLKRSSLAPNETDKEYELFKIYCLHGGGRSLQYISNVSHVTPSTLSKLSNKNNWKRRVEDYDRAELVSKMKQLQTSRHELHLRKLEKYREEQEALGQQLTLNAARIAFLANSTLSKMLDEDRELDTRDLPGMLNVAAKLADVGKNLQSSSLGVDNLLAALEEADGE
jgi:hypothetical protein